MNVWIFQDKPGVNMTARLRRQGVGKIWPWNIDRYFRETTTPHIEQGDTVLQWQPNLNEHAPAGIYALGKTTCAPYYQPNEKTKWQVAVEILEVYASPLPRDPIARHPALADMQILKMPHHIVFRVTPEEWYVLQGLLADLTEQ